MQDQVLPATLFREGDMMISAILRDLVDAGHTDLVCTRDKRLEASVPDIEFVPAEKNIWEQWEQLIYESDAVLVIAPESNDVLYKLTRLVEQCNRTLIGCSSNIVRLTGSKQKCCDWLLENNLPSIPVHSDITQIPDCENGWVVKPDDGVGGEGVVYVETKEKLERFLAGENQSNLVFQEFIPGIPASISMITANGEILVLSYNRQYFDFSVDGRGKLSGLLVNGLTKQKTILDKIARQVGVKLPSSCSYIGIDLIIAKDGPGIVEINPRLTTAYAGLRQAMGCNPAEFIMEVATNRKIPDTAEFSFHPVRINL